MSKRDVGDIQEHDETSALLKALDNVTEEKSN